MITRQDFTIVHNYSGAERDLMVSKRHISSQESSDSLIVPRRRGLESLARTVSPPIASRKRKVQTHVEGVVDTRNTQPRPKSGISGSLSAAIEAGERTVIDEAAFYINHVRPLIRPPLPNKPRLGYEAWVDLYRSNANYIQGKHFVVHQHDHPIAGTHYDLRLQCNPTSSISFAVMYGLPGNPNSQRLNRNATETRVHCLWNHLIETASHSTGSMLIWDTGEYEILPYKHTVARNDSDDENGGTVASGKPEVTEQEKLKEAFLARKVKLRLHGTRLPRGYTLSLRLTKDNNRHEQPEKPKRKRRRRAPESQAKNTSEPHSDATSDNNDLVDSSTAIATASDDEDEDIRAKNAYRGATNDIGSIHQRRWYLSIDRSASGFVKHTVKSLSGFTDHTWEARQDLNQESKNARGFPSFVVGGRDIERSIVTGRLGNEILADEGVVGYVTRGLWRAITE